MIEGAEIYYIFSFCFSPIPLSYEFNTIDNKSVKLGDYLRTQIPTLRNEHYNDVQWHESEEKESPKSRSSLYIPFHHLSIDTISESVHIANLGASVKKAHMAVFESGMGVMWVTLIPQEKIELENISLAISRNSIPLIYTSKENAQNDIDHRTTHNVFFSEIKSLQNVINQSISALPNDVILDLSEKFPSFPSTYDVRSFTSDAQTTFNVSWKDIDEKELLWIDKSDKYNRNGAFGENSIALFLKVSESDRDSVDLRSDKRPEIEKIISMLLHTQSIQSLDCSHASEHQGELLVNLYPDKRFRTFMHGDCLLVLHSEEKESLHYIEFSHGLFRTFCALRGCWHNYMIVNEQLDRTVKLLLQQFYSLVKKDQTSPEEFLFKQQEIIRTKGHFLTSLSAEDPLARSIGLTDFGSIYDLGSSIYRLKELKEMVQYKLSELDRLFEMVTSYKIRKSMSHDRHRPQNPRLLFLVIVAISVYASFKYLPEILTGLIPSKPTLILLYFIIGILHVFLIAIITWPNLRERFSRYRLRSPGDSGRDE